MNDIKEFLYVAAKHSDKASNLAGNARLELIERALELLVQAKALSILEESNHSSKARSGG